MIRTSKRTFGRCLTSGGKTLKFLLPALLALSGLTIMASAPAGAKSPRVTKPGDPKTVTAAPIDGGATVYWTPPTSDGGSPITGYTVKASFGGATCSTTGATTCTVTGLTNGHTYVVHVRASNAIGVGKPSAKATVTAGQGPNCAAVGPGVDLQYCHLDHANLDGADLAGANLSYARLTGATLNGADLDGADLFHANMTNSSLEGASLTNADLDSAYLIQADLDSADLTDTELLNTYFTLTSLKNAILTGSDLKDAIDINTISWGNTTCPDGTNSDADGGTCLSNLG
ncbi:MAG: pentapeptide repeat-containing protein [Acidimicrobiales bacterium]